MKNQSTNSKSFDAIIKCALSTRYGHDHVDALITVINGTANPIVATEVLLGIYQDKYVPMYAQDSATQYNRVFVRHDIFTDEVHYSYNPVDSDAGYFLIGDPHTEEFVKSKHRWSDDAARSLGITEEELKRDYVKGYYNVKVSKSVYQDSMPYDKWFAAEISNNASRVHEDIF